MGNWKVKIVSSVLALSMMASAAAFAADSALPTKGGPFGKGFANHQRFDAAQNQLDNDVILELVEKYAPESLSEWESVLAERDTLFNELKEKAPAREQKTPLSDELKEKIKAIRDSVQDGTMTREQAQEELQALGFDQGRAFGTQKSLLSNEAPLSDELKEQIETIRDAVQDGTMTREQAQEELQALGFDQGRAFGTQESPLSDKTPLSDELKEQIETIRENVKNGTMTREQAQEELQALGIQGKAFKPDNNLWVQLNEAVNTGDESKIIELLPQLLEQLAEKNQQLSARLSEINQ